MWCFEKWVRNAVDLWRVKKENKVVDYIFDTFWSSCAKGKRSRKRGRVTRFATHGWKRRVRRRRPTDGCLKWCKSATTWPSARARRAAPPPRPVRITITIITATITVSITARRRTTRAPASCRSPFGHFCSASKWRVSTWARRDAIASLSQFTSFAIFTILRVKCFSCRLARRAMRSSISSRASSSGEST